MEQLENSNVPKQLQPHVFKKGQSGNPKGRPPGKSLKERAKVMLSNMTEEEEQEFLQGLDKKIIWEMAEGRPDTKQEVELTLPEPLLGGKSYGDTNNNSDRETSSTEEED